MTQEDAMKALDGGMTEAETRALVTDPRMTRWMIQNNIDVSPANLERFIQNRMVPNIRRMTQTTPSSTSNIKMQQYVGNDITWRPANQREMDQNVFSSPQDRRLQEHVGSSGKSTPMHTTDHTRTHMTSHVTPNMNGVAPGRIVVGKGTNIGQLGTDSTGRLVDAAGRPVDRKLAQTTMNLHYGTVSQSELGRYNPGEQRESAEYQDPSMDMNKAYPMPREQVRVRSEFVEKNEAVQKQSVVMEKFTNVEHTAIQAPRNLLDILNERRMEMERTPAPALEHDARVFTTAFAPLHMAQERNVENTHNTDKHILEMPETQKVKGKSLRAAVEHLQNMAVQTTIGRERDPHRSDHALSYNPETRFKSSVERAEPGEATTYARKLYSGEVRIRSVRDFKDAQPRNPDTEAATTRPARKLYSGEIIHQGKERHYVDMQQQMHMDREQRQNTHTTKASRQLKEGTFVPLPSHGGRQSSIEYERGVMTRTSAPPLPEFDAATRKGVQRKQNDLAERPAAQVTNHVFETLENRYQTPGKGIQGESIAPFVAPTNTNQKSDILRPTHESVARGVVVTSAARPQMDRANTLMITSSAAPSSSLPSSSPPATLLIPAVTRVHDAKPLVIVGEKTRRGRKAPASPMTIKLI